MVTTPASRVDSPPDWQVHGLAPGRRVRIAVRVLDGALRPWHARAVFTAAGDGTVDPARQAPDDGSYDGVDAAGLLWSMTTGDGPRPPAFFKRNKPTPLRYELEVADDDTGEVLASTGFVRHFGEDTVVLEPLSPPAPVGSLLRARDGRPAPAVVVWPGSDGGQLDAAAMLLAAQGFTVLSLGLFGVEDRPPGLEHIDLRDVDAAIGWLLDHPSTAGETVALVSLSRGAELALQVAADNRRVGAVVAGAPSSLRQSGLKPNSMDFSQPAWEREGEALPFMKGTVGFRDWLGLMGTFVLRRPMRQVDGFRRALRDEDQVAAATIPVEQCAGPLLLIAGEDDLLWPSAEYVDRIEERLRRERWTGSLEVVRNAGVGHFACFPYALPSLPPMNSMAPTAAFSIDFGGSPAAHARAAVTNWNRLVSFLRAWAGVAEPADGMLEERQAR